MEKEDLISIIIPIYNVEKYLEKCLNSVISQTYNNIEIILVNDGSKDKSKEICNNYAKRDNRIRVIHNENKGVSNARNTGIDIAKGKYITFIDADDYVDKNYVDVLYALCIKNNADIAVCGVKDEDYAGNVINETNEMEIKLHKKEFLKELLNEKYFFSVCWAKLYKNNVIDNIRFNEDMKIGEDFEFLYKLLQNVNIAYINTTKKTYHFLMREGSATKSGFNEEWKKQIDFCEKVIQDVANTDIEEYAVKRYFKSIMPCIITILKTESNYNDIKYLKDKLKKYKKYIKKNKLLTKKEKTFFYIIMINPYILKKIFQIKQRMTM